MRCGDQGSRSILDGIRTYNNVQQMQIEGDLQALIMDGEAEAKNVKKARKLTDFSKIKSSVLPVAVGQGLPA